MTIFSTLRIEGFGSFIEPIVYELGKYPLNIIQGLNGHGKTTIFNAFSWVLTGKTIKEKASVCPWPTLIDKNYKGTKVTLIYFKDGVERVIIHCKEYKEKLQDGELGKDRLLISVGGKILSHLKDKNKAWEWIKEDTGYNFDFLKTSVLFGQRVRRIMDEDGPRRNQILEEAFEATFISRARAIAEKSLENIEKDHQKKSLLWENAKDKLEEAEDALVSIQREKARFDENLEREQLEILNLMEQGRIPKYPKDLKNLDLEKIESEIMELSLKLREDWEEKELRANLNYYAHCNRAEKLANQLNATKKRLTSVETKCSYCGGNLDPKKIKKQRQKIKQELDEVRKELEELNLQTPDLLNTWEKAKKEASSLEKYKKELDSLVLQKKRKLSIQERRKAAKEELRFYKKKLEELQSREFPVKFRPYRLKIKEAKKAVTNTLWDLEEVEKERRNYTWLIKDPLSNSGLKAYIFKGMLEKTNHILSQYEYIIGFRVEVNIDLSKARKDFSISVFKGKEEVPHKDLSGGQKQLVDVCLSIAINKSQSEEKECNLMMFDEVFESLDEENIEKVGDLLISISKGKSLHIITHNKNFRPPGAHVTLIKQNKRGESRIEK